MSTPVHPILDFSNIGITAHIDARNDSELPEQDAIRPRTQPEFAAGRGPYARRAYGRERRYYMRQQEQTGDTASEPEYNVTTRKKVVPVRFNPVTIDNFFTQSCPPGHTRIFKHLIGKCSDNFRLQSRLLVCLPFTMLRKYVNRLLKNDFSEFEEPPKEFIKRFPSKHHPTKDQIELKIIWEAFIKIRLQMLRLVNAFLYRRAQKRMMVIPNYITMEDPPAKNCIEWTDLDNR